MRTHLDRSNRTTGSRRTPPVASDSSGAFKPMVRHDLYELPPSDIPVTLRCLPNLWMKRTRSILARCGWRAQAERTMLLDRRKQICMINGGRRRWTACTCYARGQYRETFVFCTTTNTQIPTPLRVPGIDTGKELIVFDENLLKFK